MSVSRRIAKLLKIFFLLLIVLVIAQVLLVYIGVSFTSDKARVILLEQIKVLTQREAYIDSEVRVTVSLLPELLVKRIHVKNAEGFGEDDFIALSETRVQISLLSLLSGNIEVTEFVANRAHIGLIMKADGSYNWSFDHLIKPPERINGAGEKTVKGTREKRSVSVDRLVLTDITVRYVDEADSRVINNHFSSL